MLVILHHAMGERSGVDNRGLLGVQGRERVECEPKENIIHGV